VDWLRLSWPAFLRDTVGLFVVSIHGLWSMVFCGDGSRWLFFDLNGNLPAQASL
jgi:hypothetical protein